MTPEESAVTEQLPAATQTSKPEPPAAAEPAVTGSSAASKGPVTTEQSGVTEDPAAGDDSAAADDSAATVRFAAVGKNVENEKTGPAPADPSGGRVGDADRSQSFSGPATAPNSGDAPTVQIPVMSHVPKRAPERIPPRSAQPVRSEPEPVTLQPSPTRIPASRDADRRRRMIATGIGAVVVVAVIAAVAIALVLQNRAQNSPESRIRACIVTCGLGRTAGDLDTLRASTCGSLADFYASVDPDEFDSVHDLAVQDGSVPVVTSVDRIQITDATAIAQVTAHTTRNPADVTDRTFDLALVGDEWKVCSE